jgi:predicted N-acetyltransferase YhbS
MLRARPGDPGPCRVVLATIAAVTPRRVDPSTEPATLEAMDEVMRRAYGAASFRTSIDRFVAVQPDGLMVVELDGQVVGTGCCIAYRDAGFGWIGLVATEPAFERRGIATMITDALSDVLATFGCASVLDASLKGAPVYERMGFVDHGLTTVMSPGDDGLVAAPSTDCEPIDAADLDAIAAYDAARFGADRRSLLTVLLDQCPDRAFVVRAGATITGYAVAQEATLAPVVADDAASLEALVAACTVLTWQVPPRINPPPESGHIETLQRLGFERRRELRHMHRGIGALPGRRSCLAAMVSLGEG